MFNLEKYEKAIILALIAVLLAGLAVKAFHRSNQIRELKAREFDIPADHERAAKEGEKVNINEADEETLARLKGISPSLAKRIAAYRADNGRFTSIEELKKVKGIGNKILEKIRDDISVE